MRWRQELVPREPSSKDDVAASLHPTLASRHGRVGMVTLTPLVEHINAIGARWWAKMPGVGAAKSARILDWLHSHEADLGLRVGHHVTVPTQPIDRRGRRVGRAISNRFSALRQIRRAASLDGRDGMYAHRDVSVRVQSTAATMWRSSGCIRRERRRVTRHRSRRGIAQRSRFKAATRNGLAEKGARVCAIET